MYVYIAHCHMYNSVNMYCLYENCFCTVWSTLSRISLKAHVNRQDKWQVENVYRPSRHLAVLVDPRCPLERISLSPEGIPASPPRPWVHLAQTQSSGSICQNVPFQVSQTESWDTQKAGTLSCLQNHWPGIWRSDREGQLRRAGSSSLTLSHTSPPPCPAEEQRRDSRLQAWVQLNKIRRENQRCHQSPKSYTKTKRQRQRTSLGIIFINEMVWVK